MPDCCLVIVKKIPKGPVKLIKRVKIAHSFLQSVSNQFHVMQVSISSITIPPLRTPRDLHQKFPLGLLHPSFSRAFVGVAPERRAFVHKRFLPFLEFSELATDSTLGLFVVLKVYTF